MDLTDRELAIRWWSRKSITEKKEFAKRSRFPRENFESLTGNEIEWIWRNQPYNS